MQGSYAPSFVRNKKICKGLDYVSIDSYNDDPATEVANAASAYAGIKLNPPNPFESHGQGLFVVPGIFWFIRPNPLNATPIPSPAWLVQKMKLHWEYALKTRRECAAGWRIAVLLLFRKRCEAAYDS